MNLQQLTGLPLPIIQAPMAGVQGSDLTWPVSNARSIMRELDPVSAAVPAFPLAASAIAPIRARAESQGSGYFPPLWAGQNTSGCKEVSAGLLTRELADDFEDTR